MNSYYGLYLPKIFKFQKYNNINNIPFKKLKNGNYYVALEYFRDLYFENSMIFNDVTTELVLRGGVFKLEKETTELPLNEIISNKIIVTDSITPEEAYKDIDLDYFNIGYIYDAYTISQNSFFNYIPLDGFKLLNLTNRDIKLLESSFLKAGFKVKEVSPELSNVFIDENINLLLKKDNRLNTENREKIQKVSKKETVLSNNYSNPVFYQTNLDNHQYKLPTWAVFFLEVGRYIAENDKVTLYINYLDEIIPAVFITLGILDFEYSQCENQFDLMKCLDTNLVRGSYVSYLYKSNNNKPEWKKAKVIDIKNIENMDKFNPYLTVELDLPKQKEYIQKIPSTKILERIRIGGTTRKTAGSTVYVDDNLNKNFKNIFTEETIKIMKFNNRKYVNLIGRGVEKQFEKFSDQITLLRTFYNEKINFKPREWFYFESDSNHFSNINVINSDKSNFIDDNINIYVGASAGLQNFNHRNDKNVFLVNRMNISNDFAERLSNNIVKETMFSSSDITNNLLSHLNEKEIQIPKGVEILAYI